MRAVATFLRENILIYHRHLPARRRGERDGIRGARARAHVHVCARRCRRDLCSIIDLEKQRVSLIAQ